MPADPAQTGTLAAHSTNPSSGSIQVVKDGSRVVFDFGAWKSEMASRKNDDGTMSLVTVDPGNSGFAFVMQNEKGQRGLVVRDGQHVYTYVEG